MSGLDEITRCAACGDSVAVKDLGRLTSQLPVCKKCSERISLQIRYDDWSEYNRVFKMFAVS